MVAAAKAEAAEAEAAEAAEAKAAADESAASISLAILQDIVGKVAGGVDTAGGDLEALEVAVAAMHVEPDAGPEDEEEDDIVMEEEAGEAEEDVEEEEEQVEEEDDDGDDLVVAGRGLHSLPFPLNLSSPVHRITQSNS